MMVLESLRNIANTFPDKPGVYQFLDDSNTILYVGKAKSLKKRVQSYLSPLNKANNKTKQLLKRATDIKYTVVDSESEALLLENVFIKQYKPKYNILLKDDKTYPWICIKNEPFSRVILTRNFSNTAGQYFGPFSSVLLARTMLDLIKKLYPLRTCNYNLSPINIQSGKLKPCLELHLGNCLGPCISKQTREDYDENIKAVSAILKGNIIEVLNWLKKKMNESSLTLDFEAAEMYRKKIDILEKYKSKTIITGIKSNDLEVYNYYDKTDYCVINLIKIQNGTIIQTYTVEIKRNINEDVTEILSTVMIEMRNRIKSSTKTIVIPKPIDFKLQGINYIVPKSGDKKKLLEMSFKNCIIYSKELEKRRQPIPDVYLSTLEAVQNELRLKHTPFHIECFDNSNLQGSNPVSSCVVFRNALPSKKEYRHFNVKTVKGIDDYLTMQEVVYRRYKRLLEESRPLPNLILIDGGRGQLNAAIISLKKLEILSKVEVCSIAKKNEELIFADSPTSISLNKKSIALRLMQQIRDEAHRFGVKHHINKRKKEQTTTSLITIQGIGRKSANILLSHFKSLDNILKSDIGEIAKLVGKDRAVKVVNFLNAKSN